MPARGVLPCRSSAPPDRSQALPRAPTIEEVIRDTMEEAEAVDEVPLALLEEVPRRAGGVLNLRR